MRKRLDILVIIAFLSSIPALQAAAFDDHIRLGMYHMGRHEYGRAVSEFEAALHLKPDAAAAQYNLGVSLRLWGDLQGAETALNKALELQPDFPEAHFVLGLVYGDRAGQEERGLEQFQAAIAQNPSFADAHFNLGVIQWKRNEIEKASDQQIPALPQRRFVQTFGRN